MRWSVPLLFCFTSVLGAQSRPDLFQCEGCEAIREHSFDNLSWSTRIPPAAEPGDGLILSGVVYQKDGRTPAPGVIVYAYHTNTGGVYPTRGDEQGWGRRHGYLRGWVKTNELKDDLVDDTFWRDVVLEARKGT